MNLLTLTKNIASLEDPKTNARAIPFTPNNSPKTKIENICIPKNIPEPIKTILLNSFPRNFEM